MGMGYLRFGFAAFVAAVCVATGALAESSSTNNTERPDLLRQLPKPVQKTAQEQLGGGSVVTIHKSGTGARAVFGLDCAKGDKKWHLEVAAVGKLLARAEEVSLADAPAPVRQTVLHNSRGAKLESLAKVTEDGQEYYEAAVSSDAQERTLVVAPDGKLLDTLTPENPGEQPGQGPPPTLPIPGTQPPPRLPGHLH